MSFRKQYLIKRTGVRTLTAGLWVVPPEANLMISATVQPETSGDYDYLLQGVGGGHIGRIVRIYTNAILIVEDPRQSVGVSAPSADRLIYGQAPGNMLGRYKVCHVSSWTSGMSLDHFRYLAVEEPE